MADVAVLEVHLHGSLVGTLTRLPDDRNLFVFDPAYVEDSARATLSLSFKDVYGSLITRFSPAQTRLPPFFSNLLPEGVLRDYLAGLARVKTEREFFLAWVLGSDLPGAVQLLPRNADSLPLQDERNGRGRTRSRALENVLRFSLAGVQLKFSAVQRATGGLTVPANGVGGSWIVKLPSAKFVGVPENEFAMMELARRVGIEVPETRLVPIKEIQGLPEGLSVVGDKAFAIRRFDRADDGRRIHIEDFAQVFGVYPDRKYEKASYRSIAKVLWAETGEEGIAEFLRRLIFNVLIGNADMHLKNWSLIYPDRRSPRIAPAYDFVSTIGFLKDDRLALSFADSKAFASVTREEVERFAAKAGLPRKLVVDTAVETVVAFRQAWRGFEVPSLTERARAAIDKHLKTVPLWGEVGRDGG